MIKIMNRLQAINYSYLKNNPDTAIVSISTPNDFKPSFYLNKDSTIKDVIYLRLNDIEEDIYINGRLRYKSATLDNLKGLKDFIDKNKHLDIIVHCDAGISRSSAIAIAIHRYLGLDDSWIWNSNEYYPNRLVLRLALEEFGINQTIDDFKELIELNAKLNKDNILDN